MTFLETLTQLQRLKGPATITRALHLLKEREAGRLCYQAEEDLPHAELTLLKDMLRIHKETWERYKQIACDSVREWIEQRDCGK